MNTNGKLRHSAPTTEDRTVRHRLGVRWLDTAFDGLARRPARSLIDRRDGPSAEATRQARVVNGGVEPPHSITNADRAQPFDRTVRSCS